MANQITNYKCPACAGPLHFDPDTQLLKCDHCASTFPVVEIEELYAETNAAAIESEYEVDEALQWTEEEAKSLRAYSCPSCGANLIYGANTVADTCPYCANNTIVPSQLEGALKPDYIIPFKLKKDEAVRKLSSYYKGKPLLPSTFKQNNHIEEIKGIYVPFWLYDGEAQVDIRYDATRSHNSRRGDYLITKTDHYDLDRKGTISFKMVPADAASKMDDALMDSLEPFDYKDLVPFEMSYLPGYLADKYDVSAENNARRAEARMRNSAIEAIDETTMGYESIVKTHARVDIIPDKVHYVFIPIWYLVTKWKDNTYVFAMNGQTGKFIGDLPVDYTKFWLYFAIMTIIGIALLWFLLFGGVL